MKILTGIAVAILAMSPAAFAFDGKEDVAAAAKKLKEAAGYSWTSSSKNNAEAAGGQQRFGQGSVDGKADKGGLTWISMKFGENAVEAFFKGEKFAVKTADGWKGPGDAPAPQNGQRPDPSMFMGRLVKTMKAPADAVLTSLERVKELKSEGDGLYTGELTEQGAKDTVAPPRPDGQPGQGPQMSDAKGSIKIWIKDGVLSKVETSISGKMKFRDQERVIDRTSTVEIKDVGATKLEVPDEAKKLLE